MRVSAQCMVRQIDPPLQTRLDLVALTPERRRFPAPGNAEQILKQVGASTALYRDLGSRTHDTYSKSVCLHYSDCSIQYNPYGLE
jgi:hypothetical protein